MKLVLICHFSTPSLRAVLKLRPSTERNGIKYKDFGLWNVNIINELKGREDIELHVIAPHPGMRYATQEFQMDGVTYHFFRKELPAPWAGWEYRFFPQSKRGYPRNRRYVKRFIREIKPDLVNLIGAENPYYSTAALDIMDIPIILHCQTVYANPDRKKNTSGIDNRRWETELKLFHHIPYIACTGRMYYDLIKGYEPNAIMFPRKWPGSKFPDIKDVAKKYDFVYFARMLNKNKGFDNAIEAIAIALRKHPEMKFLAVGSWDGDREILEKRMEELGLKDKIEIHPSFSEYTDMLQYVKQARYALLPIKMDVLSGTILEAMRMGMPVVTCRTSGTPSLNKDRETVLISDIGDNEALAANMLRLYEEDGLAVKLRDNAAQYIREKDELNAHNVEEMVAQYKAVIAHYREGKPIPNELLYNTEENIDYRKQ